MAAQGQTPPSDSLSDPSLSRNVSFSRLNARAPEFVPTNRSGSAPRSPAAAAAAPTVGVGQVHVYSPPPPSAPFHVPIEVAPPPSPPHHAVPVVHHHHLPVQYRHQHQYHYAGFGDQEVALQHQQQHQHQQQLLQQQIGEQAQANHASSSSSSSKTHKLSDESTSKILNQVEYYFSDLNLATTDHLMRFIKKDPEGYVPLSVVASFKKIKALINSNSQLATVLRNSSKLVVHEDGKKVRRQHPLTQSDMEELHSRIVVAENFPEDLCHQNLMKVFSAAGSVKTIRTCQPQTSNSGASSASRSAKADGMRFSNKLHAFVEYESPEVAEKAVAQLNDEANWRSGLKVRLMLKRVSKPSQVQGKKGQDGEVQLEEQDASTTELQAKEKQSVDSPQQSDAYSHEHGEEHGNDKEVGQRKGRNRSRGKGRGRGQYYHNNNVGVSANNSVGSHEQQQQQQPGVGVGVVKQPPGPRMPDGTRGFAMGRGKAGCC